MLCIFSIFTDLLFARSHIVNRPASLDCRWGHQFKPQSGSLFLKRLFKMDSCQSLTKVCMHYGAGQQL